MQENRRGNSGVLEEIAGQCRHERAQEQDLTRTGAKFQDRRVDGNGQPRTILVIRLGTAECV